MPAREIHPARSLKALGRCENSYIHAEGGRGYEARSSASTSEKLRTMVVAEDIRTGC